MNSRQKLQYREEKQKQIARKIINYKKIYLDLNYWIRIRDAHVKRTKDPKITDLYNILLSLVSNKVAICPVSPIVFDEVMKQSGNPEFHETIKIIELLSDNIVTITEEEVVYLQFKSIFKSSLNQGQIEKFDNLIWTKAIDAFGHLIPPTHLVAKNDLDDINLYKRYLDVSWNKSLSELFDLSSIGDTKPKFDYKRKDMISNLNTNNANHSNEFNSFEELMVTEREGTLDAHKFTAWRAFEEAIYELDKDYSEKRKIRFFKKLMEKSIENGDQVPAIIEIPAGVHSVIRNDKWEYKDFNDIFDYHHSYVAVPFFDYFFTERKLSNLLNHRKLKFSKKYNCLIEHNISNVLQILKSINQNKP